METQLKNTHWQEFFLSDLFDIKSTSSGIDRNKLINKSGNTPYITRSEKENGYDSFICEQDKKYNLDVNNVITIGLDTQTVFYQPYQFYTGQNIQILTNNNLNKHNALFFIPLLKRLMEKFNWGGNGATLTRLKRSKILLPVTQDYKPDYTFMEQYIRNKEQEKLDNYKKYIADNVKEVKEIELFSKKKWTEFEIKDIFPTIQRGKRLKKDDHKKGLTPYISSTAMNNGVDNFISNQENVRVFENCITVANSGSVGASFYQPFHFVASDHVTKLSNDNFNKYVYLFISVIITRLGEKYSFNREINDKRIQKEKIMLPTDTNGQPDYEYMENYMKKLEYDKLMNFLNHKP